ncbi:hypothetical protein TRFO_37575 [Tritrichomonas foetus]|uniref:Uncharacterized protein n=1 Tax=Tritrichomonas foetus TaxID=1144522 RepID=A0A1J4JC84_9EUKA|nr:hypothetical protein TRFO_37575 [Tritrichomonas foetus]|eukprot:OHS96273.1 hypothetical protein TRFO_37575 [Tritrichomonas foetus]
MFLFHLFNLITARPVTYGSAVQLKGLFTKNRITIMINPENSLPLLFTSRPPYKDGWYWVVEPANESLEVMRKPVGCGDFITLHNPLLSFFVSVHDEEYIAPTKFAVDDGASQWQVICDKKYDNWEADDGVQFYNEANKCFLHSAFEQIPFHEDEVQFYYLNCTKSSKHTHWRAAEGIYLNDEPVSEMYTKSPKGNEL